MSFPEEETVMPRRKKDQSEAETETLPLVTGEEAVPEAPVAVEEAAPRARRAAAPSNGNGNVRPALDAAGATRSRRPSPI